MNDPPKDVIFEALDCALAVITEADVDVKRALMALWVTLTYEMLDLGCPLPALEIQLRRSCALYEQPEGMA
jgi:hypothetical protein